MTELPPSDEAPVYRKVQHQAGRLFMITCDEGWRSTILCDSMYEDDADWLLAVLGRKPRRAEPEDTALRNRIEELREQLENLAAGLDMAAMTTAPSKKSEIEAGCAQAIRGILEHAT